MLDEKLEKKVVKVAPPFPLPIEEYVEGRILPTTIEDYAVQLFADTGRTVMVTRRGDAPIVPFREYDKLRDTDLIIHTASKNEIAELKRIGEMRKRLQILDSVPYTDVIIAHEVPTEAQLALKRKRKENFQEGLHIAKTTGETVGVIAWQIIKVTAIAAFYVAAAVVGLTLGILVAALCGKDPIIWARLPDGEWLEVARFYS